MKAKHFPYIILGLIAIVFIIIEISIYLNKNKSGNDTPFIQTEKKVAEHSTSRSADPDQISPEQQLTEEEDVLDIAEKEPEYPGGEEAMMEFIRDNIKYPEYEREMGIEGIVYASFVVNKDGNIRNVAIIKTVPGSVNFDNEVKRVIRKMPRWKPAEQDGEKVSVRFTLPIKFTIQ